jgi:hypothetical protein
MVEIIDCDVAQEILKVKVPTPSASLRAGSLAKGREKDGVPAFFELSYKLESYSYS